MQIVGLASKSLDESKERVRAAFGSSELTFPKQRILVNLAPADVPKDGSAFDLAIALSILVASGTVPPLKNDCLVIGELGLDGVVLPARGVIGRLITGRGSKVLRAMVPYDNGAQASLVGGIETYIVGSLRELVDMLMGTRKPVKALADASFTNIQPQGDSTFDEVKGQLLAKRALELAAAGNHNILLYGPPGTGKSMLAKALREILPPLTEDQVIETTHLHSLRSSNEAVLVSEPPFRAPHHSSSTVAILGGGQKSRPGEISLAHNGVLLMDEFLEFPRQIIEALRQPLEDTVVQISRAEQSITYPCKFQLVATMNPCPCGYLGSTRNCTCTAVAIHNYQKKLSGPIADRIDIFIKVDEVETSDLMLNATLTTKIEEVRKRVLDARVVQNTRNNGLVNSQLKNKHIKKLHIEEDALELLNTASRRLELSPRSYFRAIRLARTIADIEQKETIDLASIAESLQYRSKIPGQEDS
jgi:magnesium chelatase family protein